MKASLIAPANGIQNKAEIGSDGSISQTGLHQSQDPGVPTWTLLVVGPNLIEEQLHHFPIAELSHRPPNIVDGLLF